MKRGRFVVSRRLFWVGLILLAPTVSGCGGCGAAPVRPPRPNAQPDNPEPPGGYKPKTSGLSFSVERAVC